MATVWTITNLKRNVEGGKRTHRGLATAAAASTYADTDVITAAALGLHTIEAFNASPSFNNTLVFQVRPVVAATGLNVAPQLFGTNAVPGAAVGDPKVTAGTATATYAFDFEAVGT